MIVEGSVQVASKRMVSPESILGSGSGVKHARIAGGSGGGSRTGTGIGSSLWSVTAATPAAVPPKATSAIVVLEIPPVAVDSMLSPLNPTGKGLCSSEVLRTLILFVSVRGA